MRDRCCLCLEACPVYQGRTACPFPTVLLLAAMCFAQVGIANIALPAIIGSNVVMQCSTNAALWRSAAPGERIHFSASWTEADALATCVHCRPGRLGRDI